jgi:hypothetical protein
MKCWYINPWKGNLGLDWRSGLTCIIHDDFGKSPKDLQ